MSTDSTIGWFRAADTLDSAAVDKFHCDGLQEVLTRSVLRNLKSADLTVGAGITETHLLLQLPPPNIIRQDEPQHGQRRGEAGAPILSNNQIVDGKEDIQRHEKQIKNQTLQIGSPLQTRILYAALTIPLRAKPERDLIGVDINTGADDIEAIHIPTDSELDP